MEVRVEFPLRYTTQEREFPAPPPFTSRMTPKERARHPTVRKTPGLANITSTVRGDSAPAELHLRREGVC